MVSLLSLKRLLGKVEFKGLGRIESSYSGRGPSHYTVRAMFLALVAMHLLALSSEGQLSRFLGAHGDVAEACGFKGRTPSQPTVNRFKHRVGAEGFKTLFQELVLSLSKTGVAKGRWVSVDSTALKAYFRADPDARHGYTAVNKPFYGYKLHLIVDVESELPIAFRVTRGNLHDSQAYLSILEDLEANGISPRHIYGDGAYDAAAFREVTMSLYDAELHTPRNPRRHSGRASAPKTLKCRRSSVERTISRLKTHLRLGELKVGGLKAVTIHILLALTTMLIVALSAAAHQLPAKIRCLRSLTV